MGEVRTGLNWTGKNVVLLLLLLPAAVCLSMCVTVFVFCVN